MSAREQPRSCARIRRSSHRGVSWNLIQIHNGILKAAMSELATKTARRVGVALTISIAVGFLMMHGWTSGALSLFLRTIIVGLSATIAFALFEVFPPTLPRWVQRWALQVIAVGVFMPLTTLV